jgi:glyoxylase-like metal-dependent hydrolase (beta-lactamase superfamily II)
MKYYGAQTGAAERAVPRPWLNGEWDMPDPVRTPSVLECCTAAAGFLRGLIRPRPADQRFVRSIADAGLPAPARTVTVTALPQVPRPVPTAAIVEGTFTPRRITNALTSFVVEHPQATFIVDPSVCLDAEHRAIAQLPAVLRVAVRPPADTIATIRALHKLPAVPKLDFALPTHAHWDHVCGLLDLPGLPVHLHRREHEWIFAGTIAPVGGVRDSLRDRPLIEYELDGPPVLTFTRSHDLFGDGTVVLVDLAGHTPGQVGVLTHTPRGWILLAGDAAWHSLQIDKVRQKPSYPGDFADVDRDETFKALHRLHLARHTVTIIPTHDHRAALPLRADLPEPEDVTTR